jgi:hypothetical protein
MRKPKSAVDEHDQPTEPIPTPLTLPIPVLLPGSPPINDDTTTPIEQKQSLQQPVVQSYPVLPPQKKGQPQPSVGYAPPALAYPYLPSAPDQTRKPKKGRKTLSPEPEPESYEPRKPARRRRRSAFPALVRFFFVIVQLVLLASFVLRIAQAAGVALLGQNPWWLSLIYTCADLLLQPLYLIQPVQLFLQQFNFSQLFLSEIYTLLALLIYGILSRILVGILRVVWR